MDNARGAGGFGRWLGFVTAVWVQCISGNNYSFSNYSHALKTIMGLTQLQLNNLSVAKDVGKAFGLLAGLASDRLSTPVILLIGVLEGLLGYGAQWLVVRQSIRPLPYWQMCVFLCMGGNSTTWMNTAVLVTCMRNFRRNRGPVSGILKGYVGLSTAIFTDLCTALFADDPAKFLLMLAVVPAIVCISAMLFLREEPSGAGEAEERYDAENKYFGVINAMAVVIAVYLLGFNVTGEHSVVVSRIFVSILAVLLLAPLAVPLHIRLTAAPKPKAASSELDVENSPNTQPLLTEGTAAAAAAVGTVEAEEKRNAQQAAEGKKKGPAIGEDHSIMEALSTADFWVLFASFLCGVGTGLTVMNNMGQMGQAMGYDDVSMFVSLISICGFFGRIGSGTISEYFIQTHAIPRPLWNAASQMVMAGGYVVMAVGLPGSLYVGSVVVGLCYGVRLAVSVPTASELFGLKYYGLIYNVLILNLPLGSFLFSGLLAGLLYDAQATKTDDGGNTCVGAHCYRMVFVIMAVACVVGLALDVVLALRTTKLYKKIHMSKKLQAGGVRATNS